MRMNSGTTYSIVDDDGNVYAHDISSKERAKLLLGKYKKRYPNASGLEIIR